MRIAHVVGQVVSTAKHPGLSSFTLLLVRECDAAEPDASDEQTRPNVAVDLVGAGLGELVLVVRGSAARVPAPTAQAPTDLAVVGIVDAVSHQGTVTYTKA